MAEKTAFAVGDKVKYKHGFGLSTGTISEVFDSKKGPKAVVDTANGKRVTRPLANLQRA